MNSGPMNDLSGGLGARAIAAREAPYLDILNTAQREAVEALEGPVLMLAGAGTGKTRALTTRVAHLINTGHARPNEILAVTFTNKAAREMKSRVGGLLGTVVEGMPWLGTFHGTSARILRRHAELVGLQPNFTILDTDDQLRLLKQVLQANDVDTKRFPARHLAGIIDRWKNRAWDPGKVPEAEAAKYDDRAGKLYADYQRRLRTLNAADFGDLLLHVLRILKEHGDVLARYQRWFRYILVDEYQDTNVAQYLWLRLLASSHRNVCCVGDDDQSIYGWRGAEVGNILRFEVDFPGARVVRLERNYRSTQHILSAASAIISNNLHRLGKTLWTDAGDGEKVRLIGHFGSDDEAAWVGDEIVAFQDGLGGRDGISPDDVAVLVRTTFQMRAFEDRFLKIGLPYRVIGGPRFYERMEVRDAIAYLRLAVSPEDSLAFERIVNIPRRGVGSKSVRFMFEVAREKDISLREAARRLVDDGAFTAPARRALRVLLGYIDQWHAQTREGADPHVILAARILDESGYTHHWQQSKELEAPGRLENLKELVKSLEQFENLQGFLDHVALVTDNEQETGEPRVSLMTLHAAKGLEFPVVFLPGWEDGLFPLQRSLDEGGLAALEEERRLGYVGITRAERHCFVSFTTGRFVNGEWRRGVPSRFIDELPEDDVEILSDPGLYGGGYAPTRSSADRSSGLGPDSSTHSQIDTPGWRRASERLPVSGRPRVDTSVSTRVVVVDGSAYKVGERVFHQKFGYGQVLVIEGGNIRVAFEKSSEKTIRADYLESAPPARP